MNSAFKYCILGVILGGILGVILASITFLFLFRSGELERQYIPDLPIDNGNNMASPELKALGEYFGVKNVDSEFGIISEIKIKLDSENICFYNEILTDEEMRDLESYTADDPILIKKINEYHSFIRKIKGKSIFIIPK